MYPNLDVIPFAVVPLALKTSLNISLFARIVMVTKSNLMEEVQLTLKLWCSYF